MQIGAELLCKGERGEAARGHVGMVTWGQGEEAVLKGGSMGKPDDWLGKYIFGCQVTGTGIASSGAGRWAIGSRHPGSGG